MSTTHQKKPNKIEKHFKGPILITAPHGVAVYRIKKHETEIHKKENFVTIITKKLSNIFETKLNFPISCITWDSNAVDIDPHSFDPNYLKKEEFSKSLWNQGIKEFKLKNSNLPLLHIDIHGFKDRKENFNIDVGIEPMKILWKNEKEFHFFQKIVNSELKLFFKPYEEKNYGVSENPKFKAYWKDNVHHSMSHQSVLEGIPSFQLEMPSTLRWDMAYNDTMLEEFAETILTIYQKYYHEKMIEDI
eukprot:gene776-9026_t